jgi:hypothetical protein
MTLQPPDWFSAALATPASPDAGLLSGVSDV